MGECKSVLENINNITNQKTPSNYLHSCCVSIHKVSLQQSRTNALDCSYPLELVHPFYLIIYRSK